LKIFSNSDIFQFLKFGILKFKKEEEGNEKDKKKRAKLSFHVFYGGAERKRGGAGRNYQKYDLLLFKQCSIKEKDIFFCISIFFFLHSYIL